MRIYQRCIIPSCGHIYDIREVKTSCERCGNLLDVVYDGWRFGTLGILKEVFSERRNHKGNIFDQSGVWRFREFLPFFGDPADVELMNNTLASLDGREGYTAPMKVTKVANYVGLEACKFFVQFEGYNPSGSFKDNGMAAAFTHAKMVAIESVACASTGNTSASVAAFAANEGNMKATILIGEGKIAMGKLSQALDYGAKTIQIKGDFDDAMKRVKEVASKKGIYLMNSVNPFRLEGQKTIMYRVLEGLNWEIPDWIVCPGGNLGNSSAFGKAFMELKEWGLIDKIPKIAVIVAEGANTLHVLVNEKGLKWNKGNVDDKIIDDRYSSGVKAHTIASAIEINMPVNLKKLLRALEFTNGVVDQVSDEEILDAKAIVGMNGFGCEPASAASVAGVKKLVDKGIIKEDETVVAILTGHQLKDPKATINYHSGNTKFANGPIVVENDVDAIIKAIDG